MFEILTRAPDGRWINDWLYPAPEGEGLMLAETFPSRDEARAALDEFFDEAAEEMAAGQRAPDAMPRRDAFRIHRLKEGARHGG